MSANLPAGELQGESLPESEWELLRRRLSAWLRCRLRRCAAEVEDVVQAALLAVWQRCHRYPLSGAEARRAYAMGAAARLLQSKFRRDARWMQTQPSIASDANQGAAGPAPERALVLAEAEEALRSLLAGRLPQRDVELFLCARWEHLGWDEARRRLGLDRQEVEAARVRIHRALRFLYGTGGLERLYERIFGEPVPADRTPDSGLRTPDSEASRAMTHVRRPYRGAGTAPRPRAPLALLP